MLPEIDRTIEQSTRSSDETLTNLASFPELNPNPVIEVDLDANITYMNPAARRCFPDLPVRKNEHPLLANWTVLAGTLISKRMPVSREIKIGACWYELVAFSPPSGTTYRFYTRDITSRKKAEEELKKAHNRLEDTLSHITDGYYTLDSGWTIVEANYKAEEHFSCSKSELIGKNFWGLTKAQPGNFVYQQFHKAMAERQPVHFETKSVVRTDQWVETHLYPRDEALDVYFRYITGRKQAEETLRQSEKRFRDLVDMLPQMVFETDIEGRVLFANNAVFTTLGLNQQDIINGVNAMNLIAPEDRERATAGMKQALYSKTTINHEYYLLRKDGSKVEVFTSACPIISESGQVTGIRGIAVDITERKQLEAGRLELERQTQVNSRLAAIGEMAAGIAHEINNPLTGVIGFAELLARKELPPGIRRDLDIINRDAQRVAHIVKRMLLFARQTKPERSLTCINELVHNTLELRAYHLRNNNIKVTTDLDPDLPETVVDSGQLQQVFLNIITNAEIEMSQAHDKGNLSIHTEQVDHAILISFKDDGPGISEENMSKLFQPFFTTRPVGRGTGLGLSICHGIVAEHGGRIWARSKPGEGATFFIELPVTCKVNQEDTRHMNIQSQLNAKAKILVVDDEEDVRRFLSQALQDDGHMVSTAGNPKEAAEKIKADKYHIILLDIKMSGMSGIQWYQEIKKNNDSVAKKIIFMTGDIMGTDTEAFFSMNKGALLTKPIDTTELKAIITHKLEQDQETG